MFGIENRLKLLSQTGNNQTVINTIKEIFEDYKDTAAPLVTDLQGIPLYEQCYSIYEYILKNVRYVEDPGSDQYIKTPARTLKDGYGDCKSMAILAASCLYNLGVPCYLRFVSFTNQPVYSHVYVVVPADGGEIIIDPVERVNGKPKFDYARPFKLKKDIVC